jgi:hypothetical protein
VIHRSVQILSDVKMAYSSQIMQADLILSVMFQKGIYSSWNCCERGHVEMKISEILMSHSSYWLF